jgi:hypothetical protein
VLSLGDNGKAVMNKVTGEKIIEIGGERYVMRFTWRVLSELEQKYGDKPNLFDPVVIADFAAGGMRKKHPEMTAEKIMELSPPLIPCANAVQEALKWAYFGPGEMPQMDDVKKNRMMVGLLQRIAQRFKQESRP